MVPSRSPGTTVLPSTYRRVGATEVVVTGGPNPSAGVTIVASVNDPNQKNVWGRAERRRHGGAQGMYARACLSSK